MSQGLFVQQLQHAYQFLQQGRPDKAEQICRGLLARYPDQPDALNLAGQIEQGRRQFEKARRFYRRGLKVAPRHLRLLNNAGWVELKLKNYKQSEALFLKALKTDPRYFYARQNLATLYQEQRQYTKAKRLYLEAIRQQPQLADALASLSSILETEHQVEEAKSYANRALEINPNHHVARRTLANIAARDKAFEEVIRWLEPLLQSPRLSPMDRAVMGGQCGDAFEKLGDYKAAFDHYRTANEQLYRHFEPALRNPEMLYSPAAFRCIEKTITDFEFSRESEAIKSPVFLIGFPRSGTTLLDQILSSHSQLAVTEEEPNLVEAFARFPATESGLRALQSASEVELEKLRRSYWANVKRAVGASRLPAVVVDKMPLNAFALLHISKLFPGARIIVALRDPRDCVFSAYQQKFEMNPAMFQLLKLDTGASLYDQVMNVIVGILEAKCFPMHFVRYEELVGNFEEQVRALIDFLELEWEDALFDYQATAMARQVTTPSAPQVIQPLYTSSIGKWRHYEEWIGPAFKPLEKWVEKWDYTN